MALSVEQKIFLDDKLSDYLCSQNSSEVHLTINELFEMHILPQSKSFNYRSISASLQRLDLSYDYESGGCYIVHMNELRHRVFFSLDKFVKEKNKLIFLNPTDDSQAVFWYDFITKQFRYDLQQCKFISTSVRSKQDLIVACLLNYAQHEWLMNYVKSYEELLAAESALEKYGYDTTAMPKGLYPYLEHYNFNFDEAVADYFIDTELKGQKKYKGLIQLLLNNHTINIEYLKKHYYSFQQLEKMIINSIRNGNLINYSTLRLFIEAHKILIDNDINYEFNTERDLRYNMNNMQSLLDASRNSLIERQLHRLNFIHGLKIDDYIVIVPQTQEDKIDEGKQQSNCVGRYYDDSILSGENLIYFLRRTEAPEKSYITCRYNVYEQETVEAKKHFNSCIGNNDELNIIIKISNIIKEGLKV